MGAFDDGSRIDTAVSIPLSDARSISGATEADRNPANISPLQNGVQMEFGTELKRALTELISEAPNQWIFLNTGQFEPTNNSQIEFLSIGNEAYGLPPHIPPTSVSIAEELSPPLFRFVDRIDGKIGGRPVKFSAPVRHTELERLTLPRLVLDKNGDIVQMAQDGSLKIASDGGSRKSHNSETQFDILVDLINHGQAALPAHRVAHIFQPQAETSGQFSFPELNRVEKFGSLSHMATPLVIAFRRADPDNSIIRSQDLIGLRIVLPDDLSVIYSKMRYNCFILRMEELEILPHQKSIGQQRHQQVKADLEAKDLSLR